MLSIICDRVGRLWNFTLDKAREALKTGEDFILLVPESYTHQAEIDLIRDLNIKGLVNIAVLSPKRLMFRVFEYAGNKSEIYLDNSGKQLIIQRIMEREARDLELIKDITGSKGIVSGISSLLAEFKQFGISFEDIKNMEADFESELSKQKIRDIARIYSAYEKELEKGYYDEEDKHNEMLLRMEKSKRIDGRTVVMYGFDDITKSLEATLIGIAKNTRRLYVTMVSQGMDALDGFRFDMIENSLRQLVKNANKAGIDTDISYLGQDLNIPSAAIKHLEQNLLCYNPKVYKHQTEDIHLFEAPEIYEEIEHCLSLIDEKLKQGYKPSDILVLCSKLDDYNSLIEARCKIYAIPTFVAKKVSLNSFAPVRAINAALRVIGNGFKTEDIESYLESGFSVLNEGEVWELRDYARENGIKGEQWKKEFKRGNDEEKLLICEALRERFIAPIIKLDKSIADSKDADESVFALRQFLDDTDIEEKIEELYKAFLNHNMIDYMYRAGQIWEEVQNIFDQMKLVAGEEPLRKDLLSSWFMASLEDRALASIPSLTNCMEIGELGSYIPSKPKVVFILGLDENAFEFDIDGILSEKELSVLENKLEYPLTSIGKVSPKHKLLQFWKAACSASEELYISYALSSVDDDSTRKANPIVKTIKDIFEYVEIEGGEEYSLLEEGPINKMQVIELVTPMIADGTLSGLWLEAYNKAKENGRFKLLCASIEDIISKNKKEHKISKSNANEGFGQRSISASSIQAYINCPFKCFVDRGLRPRLLKSWGIEKSDAGSFYHELMDSYAKELQTREDIAQLNKEDVFKLIDKLSIPLRQRQDRTAFGANKRSVAALRKMVGVCRKSAWIVTKGLQSTCFKTIASEQQFGRGNGFPPLVLKLSNGKELFINGTIDRIDAAEIDGEKYFRIIDYKSGDSSISAKEVASGLKLQLLIYLKALMNAIPELKPAGIMYQKLGDPNIDIGADKVIKMEEELDSIEDKELDKELKLSGFMLNNDKIIELVKGKKAAKSDLVLSEDEFMLLASFAMDKAADFSNRLLEGKIPAKPVSIKEDKEKEQNITCNYCEYISICRRDVEDKRTVEKVKNIELDELLSSIKNKSTGKNKIDSV